MSFNFFRTKLFKVLVVVAIFGSLIFFNPFRVFNPVRSVLFAVFSPVQKVAYGVSFEASALKNFFSSIGTLKKENERLNKENGELMAQKIRLEEAGRENETLRRQLEILPKADHDLMGASVISQDFYGHGDWIEIDRGSRDGIEKEMPVIVDSGVLIGKVGDVYLTSSKVILISNPESAINSIDSKTNSKGIIRGEYGLGIIMDMVLDSEALNQGDEVITSGVGGSLPKGLFVGTVGQIGASPDKLFKRATISSPVDFSRLQFVFIIK